MCSVTLSISFTHFIASHALDRWLGVYLTLYREHQDESIHALSSQWRLTEQPCSASLPGRTVSWRRAEVHKGFQHCRHLDTPFHHQDASSPSPLLSTLLNLNSSHRIPALDIFLFQPLSRPPGVQFTAHALYQVPVSFALFLPSHQTCTEHLSGGKDP